MAASDGMQMHRKGYEVSVVKKCLETGPHSFVNLVQLAEGLYPSDLAALLEREILDGNISFHEGQYSLPTATHPIAPGSANGHVQLPEPHPLDYDWRFSADTAERLARQVLSQTPGSGRIVLLGVPTLFDSISRSRNDCRVTLFDGSQELVRYLQAQPQRDGAICRYIDVTVVPEAADGLADVVVCDPPWYVEYFAAFLAHASTLAKVGAPVFISLLPLCTRPACDRDRDEIFRIADSLGLAPYRIEPGVLEYDTPPFERLSLARAGLPVIEQWRRGDLLLFQKLSTATDENIGRVLDRAQSIRAERQQWSEVLIGARKVKLRNIAGGGDSRPELLRIEPDDILPTVSRRYPGRRNVDLWLWDNRVFKVTNRDAFWEALRIAAGRRSPQVAGDEQSVEIALEHVRRLLA